MGCVAMLQYSIKSYVIFLGCFSDQLVGCREIKLRFINSYYPHLQLIELPKILFCLTVFYVFVSFNQGSSVMLDMSDLN